MMNTRQKRIRLAILLVTLLLTALFLAQGVTRVVAASFFGRDPDISAKPSRSTRGLTAKAATTRKRSEMAILQRNIFDSETGDLSAEPVVATEETEVTEEVVVSNDPGGQHPTCSGSIRLVAAVMNPRRPDWSFAAIVGAAGKATLFRKGQEIEGHQIVAVYPRRVVMQPGGSSMCQISMFAEQVAAAGAPKVSVAPPVATKKTEKPSVGAISNEDMESGIKKISDTKYTVQRSLVDKLLTNQQELMKQARIIPHEEGGAVVGVKMYGIRRNSLFGQLGLNNGDMLKTINGFDMSSPDSALEAYIKLKSAKNLTLQIVRRGQPVSVDYNIQ